MAMELDKRSAEDLSQTRPGYGVIFMKVAEGDVRSIEFWASTDGRLRTATFLPSEDLHEWIDNQHQESQEKEVSKEVKKKLRWYLEQSIELEKSAHELERRSEDLLHTIDQYFTEDQRNAIWSNIWHDLDDPPAIERLSSAIRQLEVKEEEVSR